MAILESVRKIYMLKILCHAVTERGIALMACVLPWMSNAKCFGVERLKNQILNASVNTTQGAHKLDTVGRHHIIVLSRVKWSKSNDGYLIIKFLENEEYSNEL